MWIVSIANEYRLSGQANNFNFTLKSSHLDTERDRQLKNLRDTYAKEK